MALTTESLTEFIELIEAMRTALNHFEVPEKSGIACVKGTLTSRVKIVELLLAVLEKGDLKPSDRQAVNLTLSTLEWLRSDKDVVRDFVDVDLPVPETSLSKTRPDLVSSGVMEFDPMMNMAIRVLKDMMASAD